MSKGLGNLFVGLFVLILSLALWRLTYSFNGWAFMFVPGAILIIMGLWQAFHED